jgi:predicted GNAT family acetyltransferase
MSNNEQVQVICHETERFYELLVDGRFAGLLVYEVNGDRRILTHTFIAEGHRNRGLVTKLIHDALEDIAARGATITNFCPIVDHFIDSHPEFRHLMDANQPGGWVNGTAREPTPEPTKTMEKNLARLTSTVKERSTEDLI